MKLNKKILFLSLIFSIKLFSMESMNFDTVEKIYKFTLKNDLKIILQKKECPASHFFTKIIIKNELDETVGRVVYFQEKKHLFYIQNIYIDPEYRNKGIGTFVLNFVCKSIFEKNNSAMIYLFPRAEDSLRKVKENLLKFYRNLGFKEGEDNDYLYLSSNDELY